MKTSRLLKVLIYELIKLIKQIHNWIIKKRLYSEIYEIVEINGNKKELKRFQIRKRVYFGLTPYNMRLERFFKSISEAAKAIKNNQLNGRWVENNAGKVVKRIRIGL